METELCEIVLIVKMYNALVIRINHIGGKGAVVSQCLYW